MGTSFHTIERDKGTYWNISYKNALKQGFGETQAIKKADYNEKCRLYGAPSFIMGFDKINKRSRSAE